MFVFAEKGVDAPVVDDVISAAGVSRGTFYKYFESNRDLLIAVNEELGNEIAISVEKLVSPIPDPAERIASGLLMFLATSARFPLFARFTYRVGLEAAGPTTLIYDYLPPHLEEGIKAGAFFDEPLEVLLDHIIGNAITCISRMVREDVGQSHVVRVVETIMRGLGVGRDRARALANTFVPPIELGPETLLMRSDSRFKKIPD